MYTVSQIVEALISILVFHTDTVEHVHTRIFQECYQQLSLTEPLSLAYTNIPCRF